MLKKEVEKEFKFLSSLGIEEYTLYTKWKQLNRKYSINPWFGNSFGKYKENIWVPDNPESYLELKPKLILADSPIINDQLNTLLSFITSFAASENLVGRQLKYIVIDSVTKKYLGILRFCSDFISLKPRDDYIKWTEQVKRDGKLQNIVMMNACVPTQPFGYNYLGGKLLALLAASNIIKQDWKRKYSEDPLVGITTNSLYGGYSQYTGLKYWKKCGRTPTKTSLIPSEDVYYKMRDWLKKEYREEYNSIKSPRAKEKIFSAACRKLGIKIPKMDSNKGVYFCSLYTKTLDFLKGGNDIGDIRFDDSVDGLFSLWIKKYASKRVKKLIETDRYNTDVQFYDDIIGKSWEETRQKYIKFVGR